MQKACPDRARLIHEKTHNLLYSAAGVSSLAAFLAGAFLAGAFLAGAFFSLTSVLLGALVVFVALGALVALAVASTGSAAASAGWDTFLARGTETVGLLLRSSFWRLM